MQNHGCMVDPSTRSRSACSGPSTGLELPAIATSRLVPEHRGYPRPVASLRLRKGVPSADVWKVALSGTAVYALGEAVVDIRHQPADARSTPLCLTRRHIRSFMLRSVAQEQSVQGSPRHLQRAVNGLRPRRPGGVAVGCMSITFSTSWYWESKSRRSAEAPGVNFLAGPTLTRLCRPLRW